MAAGIVVGVTTGKTNSGTAAIFPLRSNSHPRTVTAQWRGFLFNNEMDRDNRLLQFSSDCATRTCWRGYY
jgi:hypothetical protein